MPVAVNSLSPAPEIAPGARVEIRLPGEAGWWGYRRRRNSAIAPTARAARLAGSGTADRATLS